jgi:hypothetical protein
MVTGLTIATIKALLTILKKTTLVALIAKLAINAPKSVCKMPVNFVRF